MVMREPESVEECVYFTRRAIGDGKTMVWVLREKCPACGKALMGKPKGEDGKVKIRAKEYVCPECGHTVDKKEYEETLSANVKYTCPHCKKDGALSVPFKRKSIQGTQTLRVECEHCGGNIDITKKMK
jgi:DNA-directed RNA polymerase subunit RPC12/RpoP